MNLTPQEQAVHAIDDLGKLQDKVSRTKRESIEMLELALHALRNDRSPVTDEYIERVISYLVKL